MIQVEQPQAEASAIAEQRRSGKRHALVLLIGKVMHADERTSACLVHDISPGGLMARFSSAPAVGDRLTIEVRGLAPVAATVRWVRDTKAGVAFDALQDVHPVFQVKREDGLIARTPRFPVQAPASLRLGASRVKAEVLDISPGGAKLMCATDVQRGQAGQMLLSDSNTALFGTVCWAYDGRLGFRFVAPLPLATLCRILGDDPHQPPH